MFYCFKCNLHVVFYSIDRKTYFCTRCLKDFNHERFYKQHPDNCPNFVMEGNLIDALKLNGGFSKEIKRRHHNKVLNYAKKIKEELGEAVSPDVPPI